MKSIVQLRKSVEYFFEGLRLAFSFQKSDFDICVEWFYTDCREGDNVFFFASLSVVIGFKLCNSCRLSKQMPLGRLLHPKSFEDSRRFLVCRSGSVEKPKLLVIYFVLRCANFRKVVKQLMTLLERAKIKILVRFCTLV